MSLLEEFAHLLDELGLGTFHADGTPGGSIYLTALPTSPDECMAVARYGGGESDSRLGYDQVNIQVRVRGPAADARVGEERAQAVYDTLHGLSRRELTPGGTFLVLAVCTQGGPVYIGRDGNGRHEWTINLRCELRRQTINRE